MKRIKKLEDLTSGRFTVQPVQEKQPAPAASPSPDIVVKDAGTDLTGLTTQLAAITETLGSFGGIIKQLSDNQVAMAETIANGGQPLPEIPWASDEDKALMKGLDASQLAAIRRIGIPKQELSDETQTHAPDVRFVGVDNTPAGHQKQKPEMTMDDVYAQGDPISNNIKGVG